MRTSGRNRVRVIVLSSVMPSARALAMLATEGCLTYPVHLCVELTSLSKQACTLLFLFDFFFVCEILVLR